MEDAIVRHMSEIDWTFDGTWPWAPRFFETPEGRMHYVDEGPRDARAIVFAHGNPSWGYLFRHFIPPLVAAGHRVIVPDHLGFGRSDKPTVAHALSIEAHARRFGSLLDALALSDVVLAPHDWGGPIALAWAVREPRRVRALALFDTFLPPPARPLALPIPMRLFRLPALGEFFVQGLHAVLHGFLFGAGIEHHERLTSIVRRAYLAPHPTWSSRSAILALLRQYPDRAGGPVAAFHERIHRDLRTLADRPTFIAWAGRDTVFVNGELDRWIADFPRAQVLHLPDAGHFIQEDAHERIVPAFMRFLAI